MIGKSNCCLLPMNSRSNLAPAAGAIYPDTLKYAPSPVITLKGVSMTRDRRVILSNVDFTIYKGDFVAITGPNGGGKTTLLRIILGLLKPSSGTAEVAPGLRIGYLPQKNMIDSHFPISVWEVVKSGLLTVKNLTREQKDALTMITIEQIGMADHADRPIGELSGGQLQRTLLGRAIISNPDLLVLDEPLSYIDKKFEDSLYRIIAKAAKRATVLLVSHEMTTIADMANRHLIVDRTIHQCAAAHHFVRTDCDE